MFTQEQKHAEESSAPNTQPSTSSQSEGEAESTAETHDDCRTSTQRVSEVKISLQV